MSRPASRVVFVGNIPYGLTEEQITEIFNQAGRVQNFRLVYDRETGRPKGFGFAEYLDTDSAASAVRNLNDYEIMGRKLRVDFSNESGAGDDDRDGPSGNTYMSNAPPNANGNGTGNGNGGGHGGGPGHAGVQPLPPLPAGRDLPAGVSCADAISRTLNTLPPQQLLDILQQMKSLAGADPARCAELLGQAPQLGYAVFQALLIMGLVSPETINSVLDEPASAGGGGYPGGAVGIAAAVSASASAGAGGATHTPPIAVAYAPPQQQQQQHTALMMGGPVGAAAAVAPTPPSAPPPVAQDPEALMRAVMGLPDETINQLPEAERQQILALRASFAGQRR